VCQLIKGRKKHFSDKLLSNNGNRDISFENTSFPTKKTQLKVILPALELLIKFPKFSSYHAAVDVVATELLLKATHLKMKLRPGADAINIFGLLVRSLDS